MTAIIPSGTTITVTGPIPYTATVTASDNGRYYVLIRQDGVTQEFQFFAQPTDVDLSYASAQIFRRNLKLPSGLFK